MRCDTCKYWTANPEAGGGVCHRYAPRPQDQRYITVNWPRTDANDWCGEWRDNPEN